MKWLYCKPFTYNFQNYGHSLANGVMLQRATAVVCQATHQGWNPPETEISSWDQVQELSNFDGNVNERACD